MCSSFGSVHVFIISFMRHGHDLDLQDQIVILNFLHTVNRLPLVRKNVQGLMLKKQVLVVVAVPVPADTGTILIFKIRLWSWRSTSWSDLDLDDHSVWVIWSLIFKITFFVWSDLDLQDYQKVVILPISWALCRYLFQNHRFETAVFQLNVRNVNL